TPPPPHSTLFPYTTLFRSRLSDQAVRSGGVAGARGCPAAPRPQEQPHSRAHLSIRRRGGRFRTGGGAQIGPGREPGGEGVAVARSEEHTSELQSRSDLVCR